LTRSSSGNKSAILPKEKGERDDDPLPSLSLDASLAVLPLVVEAAADVVVVDERDDEE